MHVCMHVCMFPPRSACWCAARHECAHARPACIITPTCYREDIYYACIMLDAMYACFHRGLLVCALFSRRACSHARPPYIIAFTRYRKDIYIMHVCVLDARYVGCRRVSHVCTVSGRIVLACSPAVHECALIRCPMFDVVESMPIRRQTFARVTTIKHSLPTLAYRRACMRDTGRYHVYPAVVLHRVVPSPGRRSPPPASSLLVGQCCGCLLVSGANVVIACTSDLCSSNVAIAFM